MEENWSLLNFQKLMKSILNGDRCIQEPILIQNKKRDITTKFPFLSHLLSYQNITKDNLLEVLTSIYTDFQNKINHLKKNETIQTMMDRINDEWYNPDYIFVLENPIQDNFFDTNNQNKSQYDKSCKVCDEINQLSKIENNIPLKLYKDEAHPLDKHFRSGITICSESIDYIERNCETILSIINNLKNVDMTQFIDLSIKHKSIYLQLSNKEDDDESIPENIHRIFSNYIHIHNLLLKQMIQYYHYLVYLKEELKEKCSSLKTMKQNVQSIAYFEEDSDGGEEEEEVEVEEEGELTVVDGEVKEEKEGGFNLLSFF